MLNEVLSIIGGRLISLVSLVQGLELEPVRRKSPDFTGDDKTLL